MQFSNEIISLCKNAAREIRLDVIKMTYGAGKVGAHIGSGLSECELLAVLYMAVLNIDPADLGNPARDRFIISKGHGALALYSALRQKGILSAKDISSYKKNGSLFWAHPCFMPEKGIEFASGSLGMGLGLAAGTALALRRKGVTSRIYVLIGDGECDEGSVWEAASFVSHHKLNNITVVVDENQLQADAPTNEVVNKDNLLERWNAFGFDAIRVDGHDVEALLEAFSANSDTPRAVIARTVKGKGVSFIENDPLYHYNSITEKQFKQAMSEQGVSI